MQILQRGDIERTRGLTGFIIGGKNRAYANDTSLMPDLERKPQENINKINKSEKKRVIHKL